MEMRHCTDDYFSRMVLLLVIQCIAWLRPRTAKEKVIEKKEKRNP